MKKFMKLSKAEMKNVLGGGPPLGTGGTGEACVAACVTAALQGCHNDMQSTCYTLIVTPCVAHCNTENQQ
ncbi:hypothetical protein IDJ75_09835 [Mucilaginibacter rigui]|uniref:Bacteriocin n=1 Tax=Mucilaginibacter rigui TaxID=534635 RepID=A0ABR7X505_9SPHI|nr:hypothetical protein [Mucilaginibacter rigui]MBD1385576.1 hypothetical protein [Mucilaginibacter rigui]